MYFLLQPVVFLILVGMALDGNMPSALSVEVFKVLRCSCLAKGKTTALLLVFFSTHFKMFFFSFSKARFYRKPISQQ